MNLPYYELFEAVKSFVAIYLKFSFLSSVNPADHAFGLTDQADMFFNYVSGVFSNRDFL